MVGGERLFRVDFGIQMVLPLLVVGRSAMVVVRGEEAEAEEKVVEEVIQRGTF